MVAVNKDAMIDQHVITQLKYSAGLQYAKNHSIGRFYQTNTPVTTKDIEPRQAITSEVFYKYCYPPTALKSPKPDQTRTNEKN